MTRNGWLLTQGIHSVFVPVEECATMMAVEELFAEQYPELSKQTYTVVPHTEETADDETLGKMLDSVPPTEPLVSDHPKGGFPPTDFFSSGLGGL